MKSLLSIFSVVFLIIGCSTSSMDTYQVLGVVGGEFDTYGDSNIPQNKSFINFNVIESDEIDEDIIIVEDNNFTYNDTLLLKLARKDNYYVSID